ncbi:hypothetical protein [Polaribacter sp. SA4-12]|uniref:hypothetical protein n=1 Tax=Polaribacter sp. SA4-12 TaxID=1312072 RepID=UPI000B3CEDD3|nr:hypothetical protein [Polaribacter sp. SA4-12]ARV15374.1 hypothetical protein BTO07_09585 [Polaribacter sp. SA4-12]
MLRLASSSLTIESGGSLGESKELITGYIHSGQAFFVSSNVAFTSVTFTKVKQIHQTDVTFYKSSNPKIELLISDGSYIYTLDDNKYFVRK